MTATRFKMDRGWKRWEKAIDPRIMESKLKQNLRTATKLNGKLAEKVIRQTIVAAPFEANAPLTVMLKSSSKPLVDNSTGLFQAITSVLIDDTTVFAGVLRTEGIYNIAVALHEGIVIKVTRRMRGLFFWLWQASIGEIDPDDLEGRAKELWERSPTGDWEPLQKDTTHLLIPSRPFIREAFANSRMRSEAKKNWNKAIRQTMKELSRQ